VQLFDINVTAVNMLSFLFFVKSIRRRELNFGVRIVTVLCAVWRDCLWLTQWDAAWHCDCQVKLEKSVALLEQFKNGTLSHDVSNRELWEALKVKQVWCVSSCCWNWSDNTDYCYDEFLNDVFIICFLESGELPVWGLTPISNIAMATSANTNPILEASLNTMWTT